MLTIAWLASLLLLFSAGDAGAEERETRAGAEVSRTSPDESGGPSPVADGSQRLIDELREQARRLEARERAVAARERAVAELEAEALAMLEEVESMRALVEERIAAWEERIGDRVLRLAKVYAEMPAARAAPLLERLDLDLSTEILAKMKHKSSAQVLALMSKETAVRISKRVARPLTVGSVEPELRSGRGDAP